MQWPLTSQLHGSILKENNCFFDYGLNPPWYLYNKGAICDETVEIPFFYGDKIFLNHFEFRGAEE
jgi:hypothetical protein